MIFQTTSRRLSRFVPKSSPISDVQVDKLAKFIRNSKNLLVLTGAGISTESGIPDYRSEKVGLYARTDRRPLDYQVFVKNSSARRRFWARNHVGWHEFSTTRPNKCHEILSKWEMDKRISWIITQNVDSLHTKAGSKNVTELHGCSFNVVCMKCHSTMKRKDLTGMIEVLNPDWSAKATEIAPDGDVFIPDELVERFKVPNCKSCGGDLKPDVVFFGDNVKKPIVDYCMKKVDESDGLLVLGSSLQVYSGYRFLKKASNQKKKISIVNVGKTRGDELAQLKIDTQIGPLLEAVDKIL